MVAKRAEVAKEKYGARLDNTMSKHTTDTSKTRTCLANQDECVSQCEENRDVAIVMSNRNVAITRIYRKKTPRRLYTTCQLRGFGNYH